MRHRHHMDDWSDAFDDGWFEDDAFGDGSLGASAGAAATQSGGPPVFTISQIIHQLRTSWGGSLEGTTESWAGTGAINDYIGGVPWVSGSSEILAWTPMTTLMIERATLAFALWDGLIARALTPTSIPGSAQMPRYNQRPEADFNRSTGH